MTRIAIINYGLGNLSSVANALSFVGAEPFIAETPSDLDRADKAILPGVGAFGDGMKNLRENGWIEKIHDFTLVAQKPFLGICLGMQLLATTGTEHGDHQGLDLIKGTVIRLTSPDKSIRIPHIGWNDVKVREGTISYQDIAMPHDFYFVHSYALLPDDPSVVSATCHHGQDFVASVENENIWGAQFHPEKSQRAGLGFLKNFITKA